MKTKMKEKTVGLNAVILTKVKVKSINNVDIPARDSTNLIGYAIRLYDVHVCD